MMVVMTPEATPAQIDAIVERLQAGGVHAKVMPGELTTAIGAIGDPQGVLEMGLEGLPGRRSRDPDLPAVQARVERAVAPRADDIRGQRTPDRRAEHLLPDCRTVHRRVA